MSDDCGRENLGLIADTGISRTGVARKLGALVRLYGKPACTVSDNGTECTSKAILKWANKTASSGIVSTPESRSRMAISNRSTAACATTASRPGWADPFPDALTEDPPHRNGPERPGPRPQAGGLADRHPAPDAGRSGLIRDRPPNLRRDTAAGKVYRVPLAQHRRWQGLSGCHRRKGISGAAMPGRMENHLQTDQTTVC